MATTEQITRLAEATTARHKLLTGTRVVKVNKDGMSVEYTSATLSDLNAYISELELLVSGTSNRRRPARFSF